MLKYGRIIIKNKQIMNCSVFVCLSKQQLKYKNKNTNKKLKEQIYHTKTNIYL